MAPIPIEQQLAQIESLLTAEERRIVRAYLQAVGNIANAFSIQEIIDAIAGNQSFDLIRRLQADLPQQLSILTAATLDTYQAGAAFGSAVIEASRPQVIVRFDLANEAAISAVRQNDLRLVTNFTNAQILTTQQALQRGVTEGRNPRDVARDFRQSIGLTQRQEQAVANYRRALEEGDRAALRVALRDRRSDSSVRAAIEAARPLPASRIDSLVERYRGRHLTLRAETIARTEALRAANEGQYQIYQQAIREGKVEAESIVRRWVPTRDARLRDSHAAVPRLNPDGQPSDGSFLTGNGNRLRFPGDPLAPGSDTINCRCAIATRIESAPA